MLLVASRRERDSTKPPRARPASAAAISPSMSAVRRESKLLWAASRKARDSTKPPSARPSMVQIAAAAISRAARDLSLRRAKGGVFQTVSQAAHGVDQVGVELLTQAADEHFDGVGEIGRASCRERV